MEIMIFKTIKSAVLCNMAIGNKGEISFKKLDENRKIGFKGTQENE